MRKGQKGFTLVELIIVIAVIGVLAAILIPVFANVIDKANKKSAYSDAKNATTMFIEQLTAKGIRPTPDTLFFMHKGGNIYVCGYSERFSGVQEYAVSYDYGDTAGASFNAKVLTIIDKLKAESVITEYELIVGRTEIDQIITNLETETLDIAVGFTINNQFTVTDHESGNAPEGNPGGGEGGGGEGGGGEGGGGEGGGGESSTDDPVLTEGNIVFEAGDNSANGGGVKSDGSMPGNQTVAVGSFATVPDDKIPHSASLTAGNTNAYAFRSWLGSDGNTYYPGDSIKIQSAETLTLTAQWESGYTVLTADDDFEQVFDNLSGKFIMGADVAIWYSNSSYLFPIGFDSDNYSFSNFTGVLDGAGYEFSNLTCEYGSSSIPSALIYTNAGTISNMKLKINTVYSKGGAIAAVACYNNGTIRNVDVTYGQRSGYHYGAGYDVVYLGSSNAKVGGVAAVNSGTISGCRVDGLTLYNYEGAMGGIVGENKAGATVEKCYSNGVGVITDSGSFPENIGGLVGYNKGTVRACMSVNMTTDLSIYAAPIGGLVGCHAGGAIEDCYVDWSANTMAPNARGYYYAGVLVGDCTDSGATITNCVGIGNSEYTDCAFNIYPLSTGAVSSSNVSNCYIVGQDNKGVVTVITADELVTRTPLSGLTDTVWDFSSGAANIPCCN